MYNLYSFLKLILTYHGIMSRIRAVKFLAWMRWIHTLCTIKRERERERGGYKCTAWRSAKKFLTANIIIQTKFKICYMIRKYTWGTGTEISGLAPLIRSEQNLRIFYLNSFSVNLASIQTQKITSKIKYTIELI